VFAAVRRGWDTPPYAGTCPPSPAEETVRPPGADAGPRKPRVMAVVGSVMLSAVETGIESGAGIWGYRS
jgi:hypothetical protein